MRILFLDIDGVLNYAGWNPQLRKELLMAGQHGWPAEMIDPSCVEHLNQIVEETGAKVVISSTWRRYYDVDTLTDILEKTGFTGEILGMTPARFSRQIRGYEIREWLHSCREDVAKFVILDDLDPDQFLDMKDYHVQTSFEEQGLEDYHVEKAIKILRGEP